MPADAYDKFAALAKVMEPGKMPEGSEPRSRAGPPDFDFDHMVVLPEAHRTDLVLGRPPRDLERDESAAGAREAVNPAHWRSVPWCPSAGPVGDR